MATESPREEASHTEARSWEWCRVPEGPSVRREGLGDAGGASPRDAEEAAATRKVPDFAASRRLRSRRAEAWGWRVCALLVSIFIVMWADHAAGAAMGNGPGGRSGVRETSMVAGALKMVNKLWRSAGCLPCRTRNREGRGAHVEGELLTSKPQPLRSSSSMDLIDPGGGTIRPTAPKNSYSISDFFDRGVRSGACDHSGHAAWIPFFQAMLILRMSS